MGRLQAKEVKCDQRQRYWGRLEAHGCKMGAIIKIALHQAVVKIKQRSICVIRTMLAGAVIREVSAIIISG